MSKSDIALTDAEVRIMLALRPAGGAVDRYGRIIVAGEIVSYPTVTPLRLVARSFVTGCAEDNHLYLTPLGRQALDDFAAPPKGDQR